ncbi:hypothetical protein ACTPOK_26325 [Streptomyces inhibens]|uniref:hypothetical protein n=1 Tax=Streptomyces inhibens TaxID=2293571 RepID=UPI00402A6D77
MLDRLPAEKIRHLRALADADPELAPFVEEDQLPPAIERPGFAAFVGMGRSGRSDTAVRHREIVQEAIDEGRLT